jgi:hypothetical protein
MFDCVVISDAKSTLTLDAFARRLVPDAPVRKANTDVVFAAREYEDEPKRPAPGGPKKQIVSPLIDEVAKPNASSSFPVGG